MTHYISVSTVPYVPAVALCRREDYERSRGIMDYGDEPAPAAYEEYERRWKAEVAKMEAATGIKFTVVPLILSEFLRFCERHRLKNRSTKERLTYATVKAQQRLEDPNLVIKTQLEDGDVVV